MDIINYIKVVSAAAGAFLGGYLGGMDGLLYALIGFVAADYITGLIVAIINKTLSSEVGAKGIAKKVFIFLLVGIANIVDTKLIGAGSAIRTAVIMFYIANEGISLLENAANIGLPVPPKLRDILEQLNSNYDEVTEIKIEEDDSNE